MLPLTPEVWEAIDSDIWRAAAADLRALLIAGSDRPYDALARELGYTWPTKIVNLRTAGNRLREAAAAGDPAAVQRVQRAEALARLIDGMPPSR